jgi:hypothetical protein
VPSSDLDVMVEFPPDFEREAREFAESICREVGLKPDIRLASETSDLLLSRVEATGASCHERRALARRRSRLRRGKPAFRERAGLARDWAFRRLEP